MSYDPPGVCGTALLPGTSALGWRVAELFAIPSPRVAGGWNPRCPWGHSVRTGAHYCRYGHVISFHAESRAFDALTASSSKHHDIVAWALGPEGQARGVQEIITGFGLGGRPQRWQSGRGWDPYSGLSDHRDHVHLSQTLAAAHSLGHLVAAQDPEDPPVADVVTPEFPAPYGPITCRDLAVYNDEAVSVEVGPDGSVYLGGPITLPPGTVFLPKGQDYWRGKSPARVSIYFEPDTNAPVRWQIVATDGSAYHYPHLV